MANKIEIEIASKYNASGTTAATAANKKLVDSIKRASDAVDAAAIKDRNAAEIKKMLAREQEKLAGIVDKSSEDFKGTSRNVDILTKALEDMGEGGKNAGVSMKSLGSVISKYIPGGEKILNTARFAASAAGSAITAATASLVAFFKTYEMMYGWRESPITSDLAEANVRLYDLEQGVKRFADEMAEGRKEAEKLTKNFNEQLEATNKLKQAQLEYNKALEMAAAKSQEERDAISNRYSSLSRDAKNEMTAELINRREKDFIDEERRLNEEIANAEKVRLSALKDVDRLGKAFDEHKENVVDTFGTRFVELFKGRNQFAYKQSDSYWEGLNRAQTLADDQLDIIDAKKKELEEVQRKRELLDKERAASDLKMATEAANAETAAAQKAEAERVKAEEELARKKEADLKKQTAEEERALKEVEAERLRVEKEAHEVAMRNIRERMDAQKAASDGVSAVADSARSEFEKAFAWYRDPTKASDAIAEERDYSDDYKRLQKDASRYGGKWRIDELASLMAAGDIQGQAAKLEEWRKSSRFTPEVEAMVRASAADQTRTTAEAELRKIAANTEGLAQKLDELLQVK